MAKRVLAKIQVPNEETIKLLSILHSLDYFDQMIVDSQSPTQLARIEDFVNLFEDYKTRLLALVKKLDFSQEEMMAYSKNYGSTISDIDKYDQKIKHFLDKYEDQIKEYTDKKENIHKKHLIADKLELFLDEVGESEFSINLLTSGPQIFTAIGEIPKSYEVVIRFYIDELTKNRSFLWSIPSNNKDYLLILLLTPSQYKDEVLDVLENNYFDPINFDLSLFDDILTSNKKESELTIKNLHKTISEQDELISKRIQNYQKELKTEIFSYIAISNYILLLLDMEADARTRSDTFTIWGWIKDDNFAILKNEFEDLDSILKLTKIEDVPVKYDKIKEKREVVIDMTHEIVEEKDKEAPHYSYHKETDGGNIFPKSASFIKLEAPKEKNREFISFIRSIELIHPEKMGKQAPMIIEKLNHQEMQLRQFETKIRRIEDQLQLRESELINGERYQVVDNFEDSINFIEQFIEKYEQPVQEIDHTIQDLKSKKEQLELYIPYKKYIETFKIENKLSLDLLEDGFQTCVFLGTLPKSNVDALKFFANEITDGQLLFWESEVEEQKGNKINLLLLSLKDYENSLKRVLEEYSFEKMRFDKKIFQEQNIEKQINQIEEQLKEEKEKKEEFKDKIGAEINAVKELLQIELERIETERLCITDDETINLWGWISETKKEQLYEEISNISFKIRIYEKDQVPITNPSLTPTGGKTFKAFRGIVDGMGVPSTHEVDPFKIVRFTFPIIFGIMFADVGHGIMLFLIGLFLTYRKRKKNIETDESMTGYIYAGAELLSLSGLSATIFGFLFGSLLGDEIFLPTIYHDILHIEWLPLIEPTHEVTLLLMFSLTIGFIFMQIGIWLRFIQNKKYGHGIASWVSPIVLSLFYLGVFVVLYNLIGAGAESHFFEVITGHHTLPPIGKPYSTIFLIILLIAFPALFIFEYLHEGSEGIMEAIDYVISLFSNTLSFSRILAMLLVHAILSGLPYILMGVDTAHDSALASSPIFWIIGIFWGLIIIVPIEGLFSFLQTLRLHWVEFFTKFYGGDGVKFTPLVETTKHIEFIPSKGD